MWHLKSSVRTVVVLTCIKLGFMPVLELPNNRTEYKQARFSSFSKGLQELSSWLAKYSCTEVCMESSGKYWIPVFNILEKTCWVTLAHPKYTKPQKGNKTDRKDAKWICDLCVT